MAQENLRYKVDADTSGFEAGMNRVNSASKKSVGSVKRQSRSFTQLAYALDDAQYGFRGVQNNLQQLAVTAGLSGPVILGITALLVVMSKVIDNFESANKELVAAKKNFTELTKVILSNDQQIIRDGKKIQDDNKKQLEQLKAQLEAGKTLSHTRKDGTAAFRELSQAEKDHLTVAIASLETQIDKNGTLIEQAKGRIKYAKELKAIKDKEDITPFTSEAGLKFEDPGLFDVFSDRGVDVSIVDPEDVQILEEYIDGLEELEKILESTGSAIAGLSVKQSEAVLKAQADFETLKTAIKDNFAETIISAFESAATSSGNFLQNLGAGLLSAMGSLLIQIGTAAIISGKARVAAGDTTGAAAIKEGILSVGAGVALKAGGSIIGRAGGGGGSSTTPGSRSNTSAPVSAFNSGNGGGTVTFEIGNDKLIGSLENGLRQRGTFLGTTSIN